jgi:hypothetical protein
MTSNATQLVQYFEENYVHGKIRRQMPRSGTVIGIHITISTRTLVGI